MAALIWSDWRVEWNGRMSWVDVSIVGCLVCVCLRSKKKKKKKNDNFGTKRHEPCRIQERENVIIGE